jgi:ribonuclease HII
MTHCRITLGIDEAGRGPSIGPMVIAAVALDSRAAAALTRAGLRDSKSYGAGEDAHAVRCKFAAIIRERATFVAAIEVEHTEIDERVVRGELNVLERELAIKLIERAPMVHRIIADGKNMFQALAQQFPQFESRDRAEDRHASVAAASVIAKTIRDTRFAAIRERYEAEFGPICGGGYVNAGTRRFIRAYAERYGRLPEETRRSWPHVYLKDLLGDVQRLDRKPRLHRGAQQRECVAENDPLTADSAPR